MKFNLLIACLCVFGCIACQHQNTQPDALQSSNAAAPRLEISEEVIANKNPPAKEPLQTKAVTIAQENPLSSIPWYCIISLITFDECTTEKGTRIGK